VSKLFRVLAVVAAATLLVVVVKHLGPDVKRYLKIRRM
jgi:hypothetical protein